MSRILRRPMFRGGRVSSYGTGIASGLADGGRVGFKRGGGKMKTGTDIFEAAVDRSTYFDPGALPGFRSVTRTLPIAGVPNTDYLVEKGFVSDVEGPVEDMSMAELIDYGIGEKGDVYQTGKSGHVDDTPQEVTSIMDLEDDERIKVRTDKAKSVKGAIDMTTTVPVNALGEAENILGNKNDNKEEPVELTTEEVITKNKELFSDLLGADKARGADISDMLLGFAGSQGDTTMEKFQNFAASEAKRPGKLEKIKETAAALAINDYIAGKRSAENLETTLASIDYKIARTLSATKILPTDTWRSALKKTFAAYGGSSGQTLTSNVVISDTLKELFGKPVKQLQTTAKKIKKNKGKDLEIGFNIISGDSGKFIIEKFGEGDFKLRTDLLI
jgi:hypothetical protein